MAVSDKIEERKHIGALIKKAREAAGLSQRQLAALCEVDSSDIGRIERAETDPRLSTLIELAQALKMPLPLTNWD